MGSSGCPEPACSRPSAASGFGGESGPPQEIGCRWSRCAPPSLRVAVTASPPARRALGCPGELRAAPENSAGRSSGSPGRVREIIPSFHIRPAPRCQSSAKCGFPCLGRSTRVSPRLGRVRGSHRRSLDAVPALPRDSKPGTRVGAASHGRLQSGGAREDTGNSERPRTGGPGHRQGRGSGSGRRSERRCRERAGCAGESAAAAASQVSCLPSQKGASKFGELSVFFLNNPI